MKDLLAGKQFPWADTVLFGTLCWWVRAPWVLRPQHWLRSPRAEGQGQAQTQNVWVLWEGSVVPCGLCGHTLRDLPAAQSCSGRTPTGGGLSLPSCPAPCPWWAPLVGLNRGVRISTCRASQCLLQTPPSLAFWSSSPRAPSTASSRSSLDSAQALMSAFVPSRQSTEAGAPSMGEAVPPRASCTPRHVGAGHLVTWCPSGLPKHGEPPSGGPALLQSSGVRTVIFLFRFIPSSPRRPTPCLAGSYGPHSRLPAPQRPPNRVRGWAFMSHWSVRHGMGLGWAAPPQRAGSWEGLR